MKITWQLTALLLLALAVSACGGADAADSVSDGAGDSADSAGASSGGLDLGPGPSSLDLSDMSEFEEVLGDYSMHMDFSFMAVDASGNPVDSVLTVDGLFDEDPQATRIDMMVTGAGDLGGVDSVVWVDTGNALYFYTAVNGCAVLPSQDDSPYNDFVDTGGFLTGEVQRLQPDEDINGVPSYVFAITDDNLDPSDPTSMEVIEITNGRLYIAKDGGYVTRILLEGVGVSEVLTQDPSLEGDIRYQLDFNPATGVEILLPEGCEGADNPESDYPMLDDAKVVAAFGNYLQYTTEYDFATALEFYKTEMANLGWTLGDEIAAGSTAFLSFTMGSETLAVVISDQADAGNLSVTIGGE
jgi:hypothetical protein